MEVTCYMLTEPKEKEKWWALRAPNANKTTAVSRIIILPIHKNTEIAVGIQQSV